MDFLVAKLNGQGRAVDFAALEVQSVYVSGEGMRTAFRKFVKTGQHDKTAWRRPDWRSSIQKRLMPQLMLKVPVFRRWGKKFFVAVDTNFFGNIPTFRHANSFDNSEITWLVYPFEKSGEGGQYEIQQPRIVWSVWEDVMDALREGVAPQQQEILDEIDRKTKTLHLEPLTT